MGGSVMGLSAFNLMRAREREEELAKSKDTKPVEVKEVEAPVVVEEVETPEEEKTSKKKTDAEKLKKKE